MGASAEIIVADGGSDDGTRELAAARTRLVDAPPGRGRQMNAGARAARGEILLFLHADTWLSPGSAAALSRVLARAEVAGGCFKLQLRGPSASRPIARVLARSINARSRWFRTATGDQAIFARRQIFERIGGFDDGELFEDVLFYRALRRCGAVVILEPPARTSDRRWRQRGYLRTIATHLSVRLLFIAQVPPAQLARLYRRVG